MSVLNIKPSGKPCTGLVVEPIKLLDGMEHPIPPHELLLQHPFTLNFTSPKGAGKTTVILNLMRFYKDYFHRIYVFSPTVANDPKWDVIMKEPLLARNTKLEKYLYDNNKSLLLRREKAPGGKNDDEIEVEFIRKDKKKKKPKSKLMVDGRIQFLKSSQGSSLNKNPKTMVVIAPNPAHQRTLFPRGERGYHDGNEIDVDDDWYRSNANPIVNKRKTRDDYVTGEFRIKSFGGKGVSAVDVTSKMKDIKWLSPKGCLMKECIIDDANPKTLQAILDTQQAIVDYLQKNGRSILDADRVLFIMDDLVGSDLLSKSKDARAFTGLNTRHRHFSASIFMVAQAYKEICKTIRNNMSGLVLFQMPNAKEVEAIYEENAVQLSKPDWLRMYLDATSEPYSFLFINYQRPIGQQCYIRFDTPIDVASYNLHPLVTLDEEQGKVKKADIEEPCENKKKIKK
jgi:hypothetical protein